MHTILFRGKNLDTGEWVEGHLWSSRTIGVTSPVGNTDEIVVDSETVGQYIGIRDRNGKRIFEDDVVGTPDGKEVYQVVWQPVSAAWGIENATHHFLCGMRYLDMFEVVGNIHDNPELMK